VTIVEPATAAGWWVYGVVEPGVVPPAAAGVGRPVELLVEGSVAALVARVDLAEFGEEPVRANLEDPGWLERNARAHELVLEDALATTRAVVPFRFLTVYADEAELRRFLIEHERELRAVLERVDGTVELGVKAFVDRLALDRAVAGITPEVAELDATIAASGTGRAYLLERRLDQLAREESARLLSAFAADAHARLRAAALDAVVNAVQPPELSGRPEQMVLNGAYLVRAGEETFAAEVQRLQRDAEELGITLESTGPWPPYNFVPRELGGR
jgi:Gas vesicle synthesis protein GvpL/GvpF